MARLITKYEDGYLFDGTKYKSLHDEVVELVMEIDDRCFTDYYLAVSFDEGRTISAFKMKEEEIINFLGAYDGKYIWYGVVDNFESGDQTLIIGQVPRNYT